MLSFRSKISKKYAWQKFKSNHSRYKVRKSSNDDQSRFLSPKEAFDMGSDYIVMGRL